MKIKTLNVKEYINEKDKSDCLVTKDLEIKLGDVEDRTASFIISTGSVDTSGDTVNPDGFDFSNFDKNPQVLWQHNRDQLPIGKCISHQKIENGHIATVEFVPAEISPFAEQVFQMVKGGFLNAVSIGFIPTDLDPNSFGGYDIHELSLFEFSIVTVPCNPECLVVNKPQEKAFDIDKIKRIKKLKLYK